MLSSAFFLLGCSTSHRSGPVIANPYSFPAIIPLSDEKNEIENEAREKEESVKSESEYPTKLHKEFFGYHNPKLTVPKRYLMILFTADKCENFGFD